MATEAPARHELATVGALRVLAGSEHRLLEFEEAVQGHSPLNRTQAVLLEHGRRDKEPAAGAHAFEWGANTATEPKVKADVIATCPADLWVLGVFDERRWEHGQYKADERRRYHGRVDQVLDPGMLPAPARMEVTFKRGRLQPCLAAERAPDGEVVRPSHEQLGRWAWRNLAPGQEPPKEAWTTTGLRELYADTRRSPKAVAIEASISGNRCP